MGGSWVLEVGWGGMEKPLTISLADLRSVCMSGVV